jgi:hypothetical protein
VQLNTATSLNREVRALQNPALGALLLWRCAVGYQSANNLGAAIPLQLLFLVLPIVLHRQTAEVLMSTKLRSGLRKFVEKFQASSLSKTDLILAIAPRAYTMRELSIESMQLGVRLCLVSIDQEGAAAFPLSTTRPSSGSPSPVRPLLAAAEKLGSWFGELSLFEIGLLLQVSF